MIIDFHTHAWPPEPIAALRAKNPKVNRQRNTMETLARRLTGVKADFNDARPELLIRQTDRVGIGKAVVHWFDRDWCKGGIAFLRKCARYDSRSHRDRRRCSQPHTSKRNRYGHQRIER